MHRVMCDRMLVGARTLTHYITIYTIYIMNIDLPNTVTHHMQT